MKLEKKAVTPSVAKLYLELNTKNRRVKNPVVLRYAQDMLSGNWREDTGELIKVSKTGELLDGQHRLLAVIKANVCINFHFAIGLEDDLAPFLDTGSGRNATDTFKINGIKYDNTIPSIIQSYYLLKKNNGKSNSQVNDKMTNNGLLGAYRKREKFWQMVASKSHSRYLSFAKILPPSSLGSHYAVFYDINANDAELFMDALSTGLDIKNNSIGLLRQKLIQDKISQKKLPIKIKNALIIKAWNAFRLHKDTKILKYDSLREEYPTAI